MVAVWPFAAKFFHELLEFDERELGRAQQAGCPKCRGRLDRGDYPRKCRGLPKGLESTFCKRFSLCCSSEGCRKRLTPPSVRFLGRRVYAGVVVLAASLMTLLTVELGVPRRTHGRWEAWWRNTLPETAFWQVARADVMPPVDVERLPESLFERFGGVESAAVETASRKLLVFLSPLSTTSSSLARVA